LKPAPTGFGGCLVGLSRLPFLSGQVGAGERRNTESTETAQRSLRLRDPTSRDSSKRKKPKPGVHRSLRFRSGQGDAENAEKPEETRKTLRKAKHREHREGTEVTESEEAEEARR
jgi:hypothetical protein